MTVLNDENQSKIYLYTGLEKVSASRKVLLIHVIVC